MKQNFYINKKVKSLISNLIYDIQNYNSVILKYINLERCANNYCNESRNTVVRQSFLIGRTMEALNDFNEITSNSFKLSMNFENINNLINEVLDSVLNLFQSKRVKFTLNNDKLNEYVFMMDRSRIKSSILNIFSFIFNIVKINSSINIFCNIVDYDDDENFLFMNGVNSISRYNRRKLKLSKKVIDISITFECDKIPNEIRKKLFKTPIISYDDIDINNLYLYTAYNIIDRHYGNIWIESLENKERINIVFPAKNNL